jgi:glycosyltransferase involved in cell wall biosynthesis
MKKLAIISSYGELCGNATYTNALAKEFSKHFDVHILKLEVTLLRQPQSHDLGNIHLKAMATKLQQFDYVNIQFEAGLFGVDPKKIMGRFKILANASKNLIVTLHRYDLKSKLFTKGVFYSCLRLHFKKALRQLKSTHAINSYAKLYEDIVLYCKKRDASIIVHTQRDRRVIQQTYGFDKVHDHPLTFLSQKDVIAHRKASSREKFIQHYHLDEKDIVIGLFGFISPHKGYVTAIKAMKWLPDNYKLFIFGIQHPLSIVPYEEVNEYLHSIMSNIEVDFYEQQKSELSRKTLVDRVKFCGGLSDDKFLDALLCCNFTVLPYIEVNQGGSGVASMVLDSGVPAIFSQTLAFLELEKYAKNAFKMFSIGNHLELANAIEFYDHAESTAGLQKYLAQYNLETNITLHIKLFEDQGKARAV